MSALTPDDYQSRSGFDVVAARLPQCVQIPPAPQFARASLIQGVAPLLRTVRADVSRCWRKRATALMVRRDLASVLGVRSCVYGCV